MSLLSLGVSAPGWSRFHPPERQAGHIDRPRVQRLLDETTTRERVTVVTAPSGYGKTSAVADWAASVPGRVAWLTLGPFDDDPFRVGASIVRALQALARADFGAPEILTIDPDLHEIAAAFEALSLALEGRTEPFYLVIDDAHRAGDALTEGLLGALIESGPEPLRLVIAGTGFVELTLARWSLGHPFAIVRSEQLAFDIAEVGALAPGESSEEAAAILAETQGWPIAIRFLQMRGIRSRRHSGDLDAMLHEYVERHILGALDPDLARFVRDTAVCAEFTPELAAAITGRDDAAALLHQCVRMGLFIDRFRSEHGIRYRWHSIFARECRQLLREDADRYHDVHVAAARFLEHTDPIAAVVHWQESGDLDAAVDLIVARWVSIVVGPDASALERVCASLPAPYPDDPVVLLIRACAYDVSGSHQVARMMFSRAVARADDEDSRFVRTLPLAKLFVLDDRAEVTRTCAEVERWVNAEGPHGTRDHAAVLYLLGWTELRHRNAPNHAGELLAAAAAMAEAAGDRALQCRALGHFAMTLAWAGQMTRATEVLELVGDRIDDHNPWLYYAGGSAPAAAGFLAYFADDLPRAERELLVAIRSGSGRSSFASIARMMFAFTAAATKDPLLCRRAGLEVQEIPEQVIQGVSWPAFRHASIAALEEAAGHRERALAIAARYETATDLPLVTVVLAGIVRRSGDPTRALKMLRRLRSYETGSYVRVATLATAALVQRRRGNAELTHDLCEQALELAACEGIRRPFCDGDLELRQLLAEHLAWGTSWEDLIVTCLAPGRDGGPLDQLSERERIVLAQLRTTRTMSEIAEALGVSINTIKTHQRSVYRKLGVTSRREAVRLFP